jgi:hypothetical protein
VGRPGFAFFVRGHWSPRSIATRQARPVRDHQGLALHWFRHQTGILKLLLYSVSIEKTLSRSIQLAGGAVVVLAVDQTPRI